MTGSGERLNPFALLGGLVAGFFLEWLAIAAALFVNYGVTASAPGPLAYLVMLGVPLAGCVLLFRERTRLAAASFLIGLTIGSITGAGVCAGFLQSG